MPLKVYDKVSWHFPEGNNCPSIEAATRHFRVLVDWLRQHALLSPFGEAVAEQEMGEDFSVTSEMLTEKGQALLDKHYDDWLDTLDYETAPTATYWDSRLRDAR